MIAVRRLDERVATAGQLQPKDLREVAGMGFRVVINNRPDGEAWFGQPPAQKIHDAAAAAGLQSHYLPIVQSNLGAAEFAAFTRSWERQTGRSSPFARAAFDARFCGRSARWRSPGRGSTKRSHAPHTLATICRGHANSSRGFLPSDAIRALSRRATPDGHHCPSDVSGRYNWTDVSASLATVAEPSCRVISPPAER